MTTILLAMMGGVAVLLVGNVPWAGFGGVVPGLAGLNLRFGVQVPWAIVPMAVYLWCYWKFIGGRWGPRGSAELRRFSLRATRLSTKMWGASLLAGLLGFVTLLMFLTVMGRLVSQPATPPIATPPEMPSATAFLLLAMASIVAGVTEEAAFRGYMQGPIERQYGLAPAILITGTIFGLLHFSNHPADVLKMLPYYVAVSAVYGGLTWAANSILPALVLHTGGDVWSLSRLWLTGRPEWQLSTPPPRLIWDSGIDVAFAVVTLVFLLFVAVTTRAYLAVRHLRASAPEP